MTYNETEILIKKYLNGETTAEEEKLLAREVAREDVPDDWKVIAGMLGELTVDEALFDQMMAERKTKPRIVRLWPWVAAACVAALLIVFLGPPREETVNQPQIAKVECESHSDIQVEETEIKAVEVKATEPKEEDTGQSAVNPQQTRKKKHKASVSRRIAKEDQEAPALRPVEERDVIPYEDPQIQFAEQARTLRERGNRVIQRVSMNG